MSPITLPRHLIPALMAMVSAAAFAQTTPDAGGLLRQQEQLQKQPAGPLPAPARPDLPLELKDGGGQKIRLQAVRFVGATHLLPAGQQQALVADAVGTELDFVGLQSLAERVTAHLKSQGWFLARAYLPRQDITEGRLEIALVAGQLSRKEPVRISPSDPSSLRIKTDRLQAIADQALPAGAAAHEDALNRAVLLINDLPGITARARLEPGDEEGETRVFLTVDQQPWLVTNWSMDNYGSGDTGKDRLNATVSMSNPLGLGDQLSLTGTRSAGTELARISYAVPLGPNGWRLSLGATHLDYQVRSATGRAAGLEGKSQTYSADLLYPWLRSRTNNVYLNLSHNQKDLVDRATAGILRDKSIAVDALSLNGDHLDGWGGGGLLTWSAGWTSGRLRLDNMTDALNDRNTYQTAGGYQKISYSLTRLQKLPGAFTVFASLTGQQAGKNLDSSEKLYLGGPNGVRAYSGSEGGGDSGAIASLELRYDWPAMTPLGSLQLQAFYDAGQTELHHDARGLAIPTATGRNRYGIAGTGLGLSLSQPGRHQIRASYATKQGSNPGRSLTGLDSDGRTNRARLWLQAAFLF